MEGGKRFDRDTPPAKKRHGEERTRTANTRLAQAVLYQLSYFPAGDRAAGRDRQMGLVGFEPTTSPLSGVRSSQLSYRPLKRTRENMLANRIRDSKNPVSFRAGAISAARGNAGGLSSPG